MPSSAEVLAEASRVLDEVATDTAALTRFSAAYFGPGNAIDELTTFVHPSATTAAHRAALRETAFGRADSPEAQARALQARQELEAADAADAARAAAIAAALERYRAAATAAQPAPTTEQPATPELAGETPFDPPADSPARRRPRRATVLVALGTFVLGAALATGVTTAITAGQSPAAGTSGTSGISGTTNTRVPVSSDAGLLYQMQANPGGDTRAADRLLRREAFNADVVTDVVGDYIDLSTTRRLFGQGSTIVYAARSLDKDYCLILKLNEVSTWTCNGPDQFAAQGLEVELKASADHQGPSTAARWNGVYVELVRVPSS